MHVIVVIIVEIQPGRCGAKYNSFKFGHQHTVNLARNER
jgi:hypothetical protein